MFEKEAEEYRKELKSNFFLSEPQLDLACQGFKDGYNKAKEEMQKNGLTLQSDMDKTIEQNIQLKKQIEKLEKLVPKTCENCVGYGCHAICVDCDFKDKWEIKENEF